MPKKLNEMDPDGLKVIMREIKESHDNLMFVMEQIVKYGLPSFLAPWSDKHVDHLGAIKAFSEEMKTMIVKQGVAKDLGGVSEIHRGKARSTKMIESRQIAKDSLETPQQTKRPAKKRGNAT